MAGLYEFWRDPTVTDADDPLAWLTTFTVVTGPAEPGLDRIHDRQPLVLEPEEWATWLDPGDRGRRRARPARAARARALHGLPRLAGREQQPVERPAAARPGADRGARRGGRPGDRRGSLGGDRVRRPATRRRSGWSTPRWDRRGPRRPGPTASPPVPSCSVTAPAACAGPSTCSRRATPRWPPAGSSCSSTSPGGWPGKKLGPAPASLDRGLAAGARGADARPRPGPARRRAGAARVPASPAAPPRPWARARSWRCRSRCTRPGSRRARGPRSSRCRRRTASPCTSCRAAPTRSAPRPRSRRVLPPGATLDVVTGAHSIGGSAAAVAALVVQRLPAG